MHSVSSSASSCQIYRVRHRNTFRWKWRYANEQGHFIACAEEYEVFFDCVQAARAQGHDPRSHWTGPCAPAGAGN